MGRKAQLEILNDWAAPADSHPVLLFEAIGGTGKSMLTWEWTTRHANEIRQDWAGRFWYSFYERGALMSDFCGHALAYITGEPFAEFRKKKTSELAELLLQHLTAQPWLIVLDGLERVLVAYHRIDAAQLADEDAGTSDEIADRDPCAAIRPEDDELLRALAGAAPSKLLLTSRLPPRVLLNSASQPIPGVLRERLPGLRPPDAEALFRACGVSGDSKAIQSYLQEHCDCHPLVTSVLAGLVTGYLPDKGNFDTWAADPNGGGQLNLADLDLTQKRNHILKAAMAALDDKSRQLLSTLALLSEAADYPTLCALNLHAPPEAAKLQETVGDLERRGLLQYDPQTKRHDLHPVSPPGGCGRRRRNSSDSAWSITSRSKPTIPTTRRKPSKTCATVCTLSARYSRWAATNRPVTPTVATCREHFLSIWRLMLRHYHSCVRSSPRVGRGCRVVWMNGMVAIWRTAPALPCVMLASLK